MAKILCFDDDRDCLLIMKSYLSQMGHAVLAFNSANEVLELARQHHPDLIVTDIMMPGLSGGGVYGLLRRDFSKTLPIVVSSGSRMKVKGSGQFDPLLGHCPKPVDSTALRALIQQLLDRRRDVEFKEGEYGDGVSDPDFDMSEID